MPGCLIPLLLMVFFMPALFFIVFFDIAAFSFGKLGLSPATAMLLFFAILMGSVINIPISKKLVYYDEEPPSFRFPFLFYYPPRVRERVIAVNVGGAVIPVLFSIYLLSKVPLLPTAVATLVVILVAKRLARPVPGVGIRMPALIPPLIAAAMALLLAREAAAPVAFIAGVIGTLVGADLLNFRLLDELGAQVMSIGGAGVFDGIFLVGIVAALLT